MVEPDSINANPAPAAPVLPPGAGGRVQPFLGIVMLDTRFPRPPGDVGHPDTFGCPVRRAMVAGAWPDKVVATAASLRAQRIASAFVVLMRQMERDGAAAITTSCGFLVLLQRELQAAVKVPVETSSLLQLPALLKQERQLGVLTISASKLGSDHLRAAGVPRERLRDVLVQGVDPAGEFASAILGNRATMDLALAGADVVRAAEALRARAPDLRTVVLECTNMPPYADAVRAATGFTLRSLQDSPRLRRAMGLPTSPCP
jgi:hypothetical protein